jgi:hypothetical protein
MKSKTINLLRILFFVFVIPPELSAQTPADPGSRNGSAYTYIIQLETEDAKKLAGQAGWESKGELARAMVRYILTSEEMKSPENKLRHFVDSFHNDSGLHRKLSPGSYMLVRAWQGQGSKESELIYQMVTVSSMDVHEFERGGRLCLIVFDKFTGEPVTNAEVSLDGKTAQWDTAGRNYFFEPPVKSGNLVVQRNGEFIFRSLAVEKSGWASNFLLDAIVSLADIFTRNREGKFNGYIALRNIKSYLPGDTVKLKAFIVDKKARPYTDEVRVKWSDEARDEPLFLGNAKAAGNGAYTFEFKIGDTVDVNNSCSILLYSKGNKLLLSTEFYMQLEEPPRTIFNIKTDKFEYLRGEPLLIYPSATDENGLPEENAFVNITIETVNFKAHRDDSIKYNPVWKHKQFLNPSGGTRLIVPDSVLPAEDAVLSIIAEFNKGKFRKGSDVTAVHFKARNEKIMLTNQGKYLKAEYLLNGISVQAKGILSVFNLRADTATREISFPHRELISPVAGMYEFRKDSLVAEFFPGSDEAGIYSVSYRTSDSVFIKLANPLGLDVNYAIYKSDVEVAHGNAKELDLKFRDSDQYFWTLSYNFLWGGDWIEKRIPVRIWPKGLNVKITQPAVVSPGEKVNVEISVTDVDSNPVAGVDITAMAVTERLSMRGSPNAPSLGGWTDDYFPEVSYRLDRIQYRNITAVSPEWRERMGLDSSGMPAEHVKMEGQIWWQEIHEPDAGDRLRHLKKIQHPAHDEAVTDISDFRRQNKNHLTGYDYDSIVKTNPVNIIPDSGLAAWLERLSDEIPGHSRHEPDNDVAYWQPLLYTDSNGKVFFEAVFPDTAVLWNSYVLAMNGNRQSGTGSVQTLAYNKLDASLVLPDFLVEGDSLGLTGKAINRTGSVLNAATVFSMNGREIYRKDTIVNDGLIELTSLKAESTDTMKLVFSVKADNNYSDSDIEFISVQPAVSTDKRSTDSIFTLSTHFEQNGKTTDTLHAGIYTEMVVEVNTARLINSVMLEIPLPAGCSYALKRSFPNPYEESRQYMTGMTRIFCVLLPPGTHTFRISLKPRFTGDFILNPARVDRTNFPEVFWSNEPRKISIR